MIYLMGGEGGFDVIDPCPGDVRSMILPRITITVESLVCRLHATSPAWTMFKMWGGGGG